MIFEVAGTSATDKPLQAGHARGIGTPWRPASEKSQFWAYISLLGSQTDVESVPGKIGLINLDEKPTGKRSAGEPHAAFDEAGAGLRATAKAVESPPEPNARAPVLDPTYEGVRVKFPRATHLWHYQQNL